MAREVRSQSFPHSIKITRGDIYEKRRSSLAAAGSVSLLKRLHAMEKELESEHGRPSGSRSILAFCECFASEDWQDALDHHNLKLPEAYGLLKNQRIFIVDGLTIIYQISDKPEFTELFLYEFFFTNRPDISAIIDRSIPSSTNGKNVSLIHMDILLPSDTLVLEKKPAHNSRLELAMGGGAVMAFRFNSATQQIAIVGWDKFYHEDVLLGIIIEGMEEFSNRKLLHTIREGVDHILWPHEIKIPGCGGARLSPDVGTDRGRHGILPASDPPLVAVAECDHGLMTLLFLGGSIVARAEAEQGSQGLLRVPIAEASFRTAQPAAAAQMGNMLLPPMSALVVGAFCYVTSDRFGPGPIQPFGAPCNIATAWRPIRLRPTRLAGEDVSALCWPKS